MFFILFQCVTHTDTLDRPPPLESTNDDLQPHIATNPQPHTETKSLSSSQPTTINSSEDYFASEKHGIQDDLNFILGQLTDAEQSIHCLRFRLKSEIRNFKHQIQATHNACRHYTRESLQTLIHQLELLKQTSQNLTHHSICCCYRKQTRVYQILAFVTIQVMFVLVRAMALILPWQTRRKPNTQGKSPTPLLAEYTP